MSDDYEFRFKLSDSKVRCELWESSGKRRDKHDFFGGQDIDLDVGPNGERLETIAVLEEWLKRWEWIGSKPGSKAEASRLLVPDTFKILGRELFHLAMGNEAGDRLCDLMQDPGKSIRLLISFKQASAMSAHPWEFLCLPTDKKFLAIETDLVLGRFVADLGDGPPIRCADEKLSVLFVMAVPDDEQFGYERTRFRELYDSLSGNDDIQAEVVNVWNPQEVEKKGNGFTKVNKEPVPVDVVHFIAVCRTKDGRPELYLPAADAGGEARTGGESPWTGPDDVVRALTSMQHGGPALVILHLTDLKGNDESGHFESVAPHFVRQGISAVMAMQYPMSPDHGWNFARVLYEQLADGKTIGTAVQTTRAELKVKHPSGRHFGTPVLFMQSRVDGALINPPNRDVLDEADDAQPVAGPSNVRSYADGPPRHPDILRTLQDCMDRMRLALAVDGTAEKRTAEARWEQLSIVDEWLESQNWPADLTTAGLARARQLLRVKMREQSHEFGRIFNDLLAEIDALGSQVDAKSA